MYNITICAVIWGADESILNIDLGDGFVFKKMSLIPEKDHLNKIFQKDAIGLRIDYEGARIDSDLNVICLYKTYSIDLDIKKVNDYYTKILRRLDTKIRIIRLYNEGAIRFKWLSVIIESNNLSSESNEVKDRRMSIIPIGEAMATREISKLRVSNTDIVQINNMLKMVDYQMLNLPFDDTIVNNAHRYYDLSYHVEKNVALTLLITCLELLFLKSESTKKEKMSKRCAAFLYETKYERITCYRQLKSLYKKRCEFVHDGVDSRIENEDIIFLRECVRKSILKYLNTNCNKSDLIIKLRSKVKMLDYWNS